MTDRPRIMIGAHDVTEHVAVMYDAIVGSMDWGSGFLDVETCASIVTIGRLAGFMPANEAAGRYGIAQEQWLAQLRALVAARSETPINTETCESVALELMSHVERLGSR